MSKPLSLAAQDAWKAFNDVAEQVGVFQDYGDALAAAFTAAALHLDHDAQQLLAIAAELEGRDD